MPDLAGRELNGVRRQLEALGFSVDVPPGAPSVGAIVLAVAAAGLARDARRAGDPAGDGPRDPLRFLMGRATRALAATRKGPK